MKMDFHPYENIGIAEEVADLSNLCPNMAHPAVYLCTEFNKSDEELWIQMTKTLVA